MNDGRSYQQKNAKRVSVKPMVQKEKYYAGLAEYKKTPQYEAYQKYLEDFKAKHNAPTKVCLPTKCQLPVTD